MGLQPEKCILTLLMLLPSLRHIFAYRQLQMAAQTADALVILSSSCQPCQLPKMDLPRPTLIGGSSLPDEDENSFYDCGSTLVFGQCPFNYDMLPGSDTASTNISCLGSQWSDEFPYCRMKCQPCAAFADSDVAASNLLPLTHKSIYACGESTSFQCLSNYWMQGSPSIYCIGSVWNADLPVCRPICRCIIPDSVSNHLIQMFPDGTTVPLKPLTGYTCGESFSMDCEIGYDFHGPDNIQCLSDNNWSGLFPICTAKCLKCRLPQYLPPHLAVVQNTPMQQPPPYEAFYNRSQLVEILFPRNYTKKFNCGDELLFQCQTGYALIGSSAIKCIGMQNQRWNASVPLCKPVCLIPCQLPPAIDPQLMSPDGSALSTLTNCGQSIGIACQYGYILRGFRQLTCQGAGNWNGEFPLCETQAAGPPPTTTPRQVLYTGVANGSYDIHLIPIKITIFFTHLYSLLLIRALLQ